MNAKSFLVPTLMRVMVLILSACAAERNLCGPPPESSVLPYGVSWRETGERQSPKETKDQCLEIYRPHIEKARNAGVNLGSASSWLPVGSVTLNAGVSTQEKFNQIVEFQQGLYYQYIESCREREKLRDCIDDPRGVLSLSANAQREKEEFEKTVDILVKLDAEIKELKQALSDQDNDKAVVIRQEITQAIDGFEISPPAGGGGGPSSSDVRSFLRLLAKSIDQLNDKTQRLEQSTNTRISQVQNTNYSIQEQVSNIQNIQNGLLRSRDEKIKVADSLCVAALRAREEYLQERVGALRQHALPGEVATIEATHDGCLVLSTLSPMFDTCSAEVKKERVQENSLLKALVELTAEPKFGSWASRVELVGYTDEREIALGSECAKKFGSNPGLATARAYSYLQYVNKAKLFGGVAPVPRVFLGGITQNCEPCEAVSVEFNACKPKTSAECKVVEGRLQACQQSYACSSGCKDEKCLSDARKLGVRAQWCLPRVPPACEESFKSSAPATVATTGRSP